MMCRLCFRKYFGEDLIHLAVLADVLKIDLRVDDMVDAQARGLYHSLDVIESLPCLLREGRGQTAIWPARSLP